MAGLQPEWDLPAVPVRGAKPCVPPLAGEKAESLRKLAAWFREQKLPRTPNADLVKFLHSCDYDLEKAKVCAKDFHSGRKQVPDMFTGWDVALPHLKFTLDNMYACIVPRKTPENFRVIITKMRSSDTSKYVVVDTIKVMVMIMETIFLTEPMVDGIVAIHDIEHATFSHFVKAAWYTPRKLQPYLEAGLPLKRESMHLLHCSGFVDNALRLVRSFGRQEDWDRMRVHRGDDLSQLHALIPADCLPSDYGGTLPSLQEIHDMTVERLAAFKDVFARRTS